MPKVNGKIYYNNVTGAVLVIVNQNEGVWIRETTFAQDVATYPQLKEIDKNVISVLKLAWDQYAQDFATQRPVKIINGRIQWQPLDSPPDATPQNMSFSEKIKTLELQQQQANEDLSSLMDFIISGGF